MAGQARAPARLKNVKSLRGFRTPTNHNTSYKNKPQFSLLRQKPSLKCQSVGYSPIIHQFTSKVSLVVLFKVC